jgi:hypothetical protein
MTRSTMIRRPGHIIAFFLFLAFSTLSSRAQIGVYASFSAAKYDLPNNTDWTYGPTFGLYDDAFHLPIITVGFDARAAILGSEETTRLISGMAGPRLSAHLPLIPLKPYVEGLVGVGHVTTGQGFARIDDLFLNTGVAAGADLTFFPRFDWRIVEYSYSRFPSLNGGTNQKTLSTGLVFRLPIP